MVEMAYLIFIRDLLQLINFRKKLTMYLVCFLLLTSKYLASAALAAIGTRKMISIPGHTYGGDADMMSVLDVGVDGRIGEQVY